MMSTRTRIITDYTMHSAQSACAQTFRMHLAGSGYQNARQMAAEGIARAQNNFQRQQGAAGGAARDVRDSAADAAANTRDAASDQVQSLQRHCSSFQWYATSADLGGAGTSCSLISSETCHVCCCEHRCWPRISCLRLCAAEFCLR